MLQVGDAHKTCVVELRLGIQESQDAIDVPSGVECHQLVRGTLDLDKEGPSRSKWHAAL